MGERFDLTFRVSTTALKMFGAHPSMAFSVGWIILSFMTYIAMGLVFLSFIYSSLYESFTKICTNISLALVFVIILFNHAVLIAYKESFSNLIKMTENDLKRSDALSYEDKMVVLKYTKRGTRVSKGWLVFSVLCCILFIVEPPMYTAYSALCGNYEPVYMFDVIYPEYIEKIKQRIDIYLVIYVLQSYYCYFSTVVYLGIYPLGFIFELHACGQIELIIGQLDKLFAKKQYIDVEVTRKSLRDIVCNIQSIYRYVGHMQKTHKASYEMCLKIASITIPITCFGVLESHSKGDINLDLISHILVNLMQCYFPCYYCDLLLNKGEELRVAVYGCGWERHWDRSTRSAILLLLVTTARPLTVKAVFTRVSLQAFKDICHQAYSIFNVMNAARH